MPLAACVRLVVKHAGREHLNDGAPCRCRCRVTCQFVGIQLDDHVLKDEESVKAVWDAEAGVRMKPVHAVLHTLPFIALGMSHISQKESSQNVKNNKFNWPHSPLVFADL